jgi:hypothetical protein
VLRIVTLGAGAALVLGGCASRQALDPAQWAPADVVGYRLLTKDDFRASGSSHVWGNVAHGAEICTVIIPTEDHDQTGAFRAVMNPECSFWNSTIGPLATLGGLAGASVVPGLGTQQPDWYVLQHEQIHFAINEVAARRLSQEIAEIPPERRTNAAIKGAYRLAVAQTSQRQAQFDAATSGTFDPPRLGSWVRALEKEMRRLCGSAARCWVRHQTPLGWGD